MALHGSLLVEAGNIALRTGPVSTVLGVQDAAQRHRNRPLHGAGPRRRALRDAPCPFGSARTVGRDFLDALVSLGFPKREADSYGNTPETELFLDRKKPSYIGGILEIAILV